MGVAGVVLSIASFRTQRDTTRMQIEMQQDTLALQRQVAAAQLAANAIGFLGCKADEKEEMALALLSANAPQHVRELTPTLLNCHSARLSANRLNELGSVAEIRMRFRERLQTAQEFLHHGHEEAAAQYYADAARDLPQDIPINDEQLAAARKALGQGRYADAADLFAHLFRNISMF